MPSERRLHPYSILFNIGKQFGALAVPILFVLVGIGTDEDRWQGYAAVFAVPYAVVVLTRYLSYRYRYDESELVIRQGFMFRNQRHVPYDRIQNIDAVQNVLHRLLNVVEVRLQTGAGSEPEATLSVLAIDDLEEMRRRVFGSAAARHRPAEAGPAGSAEAAAEAAAPAPRTLVRLPARELALYGIIENRGLIVIAAALGLAWQLPALPHFVDRFFGEQAGRSFFRSAERMIFVDGGLTPRMVVLAVAALAVFLLISRLFSIGWALVRLHGFTVVQTGDDLRTEYGLLTRVVQTIPRRRIQTVTIRQTPLHRWLKRASVRVSTAGGKADKENVSSRQWFAPIIRAEDVEPLLSALLPGVNVAALEWRGVHPRAFRRIFRRALFGAAVVQAAALAGLGLAAWALAPLLAGWAIVKSRRYVRRLGWSTTPNVVAFRTGAFVEAVTLAPLVRIQVVTLHESPFDRRTAMARVRVDTAGRDGGGFNVDVPYLPAGVARELHAELGAAAARTAFQW